MIDLILMLSLSPVNPICAPMASVQPCVWPNTCANQPQAVAGFQPCGNPNKCKAVDVASGPVQTCVWPNQCS
jgi:hypothetical protein